MDSTFLGNTATTNGGGAIWLSPTTSAVITGSFRKNNQALSGGALFISSGASATINADRFPTTFESNTAQNGGAIYNDGGTLTVNHSTFYSNQVPQNAVLTGYGGAIEDKGTMTATEGGFYNNIGRIGAAVCACDAVTAITTSIQRSVFTQNAASVTGGGLYANTNTVTIHISNSDFFLNTAANGAGVSRFAATMSITDSSITNNTASNLGAGLYVTSGPTSTVGGYVEISNTTIAQNTATGTQGGGIYNTAEVDLTNATIAANTNGVFNFGNGAIMRMANSVLHDPNTLNCDGSGVVPASSGGNYSDDNSCGLSAPGDRQGVGLDPKLGTFVSHDLRANTSYYLLLAGSPLIDAAVAGCPLLDQRHANRVGPCDIGAIEYGGKLPWAYMPYISK